MALSARSACESCAFSQLEAPRSIRDAVENIKAAIYQANAGEASSAGVAPEHNGMFAMAEPQPVWGWGTLGPASTLRF